MTEEQEFIFGLHKLEKHALADAIKSFGFVVNEQSNLALSPCGSFYASLKKQDGSIIDIKISLRTNHCEFCGNRVETEGNLHAVEQYLPHYLCNKCLDKIDTNEIKLIDAQFGQYTLDETGDHSCDRCHKECHYTELHRNIEDGRIIYDHSMSPYTCDDCYKFEKEQSRQHELSAGI